ncbi:MAG TPA: polysaccharide deacetylase family protein [Flavobacteriales bacterium]|nr:polysaccharide deacetylase family protein [Flavobacteriales bacterium]|tara:strand:- start:101539 stop:102171 length:633 start_codon:yes stop_codon:yes gene_type:complete
MYLVKTPSVVKKIYPQFVWNFSRKEPYVYLTFDDGPHPEITLEVLSVLKKFQAKASFFCVGKNVVRYPEVFNKIIEDGHAVGNHTFSHKNAWDTERELYLQDINRCDEVMETSYFRPPYGKISKRTAKNINKKIIMWDVLSGDFDRNIAPEKCLKNVIKNIEKGSIIVFHDSEKASGNMLYALPRVLEYINSQKWQCETIKKGLELSSPF